MMDNVIPGLSGLPLLLLGLALFLLFFLTRRDSRHDKFLKGLPGPTTLPFIGSAYYFIFTPLHAYLALFRTLYADFGNLIVLWMGNRPLVACCGVDEVEAVLSSPTQITKSLEYEYIEKFLGRGLVLAKPDRWHTMRRELNRAFHYKILDGFLPTFNEQGDLLVDILKTLDHQHPFDMYPYVTRCAMDIICETIMGVKLGSQVMDKKTEAYIDAAEKGATLIMHRFARPWLRHDLSWKLSGYESTLNSMIKTCHAFTYKVIADRKRERLLRQQEEIGAVADKAKPFLDLLLDMAEEHNLPESVVREEADTFMFAGHDTVSASLIFTIMNLSQFPEHQKIIQEELDEIFEGRRDVEITATHVSRMKYLECCIKESLRLYPSPPFFLRELTEDTKIGKHVIPRGVTVAVMAYLVHRDPHIYPDPEKFKPQRFLEGVVRSTYAFVPFSAGPRNCIGQKFAMLEEKVVLAKLLQNFNFALSGKIEDIKIDLTITLRPLEGVNVIVTPRP